MASTVHELTRPSASRRRWRVFFTWVLPPLVAILIVLVPTLSTVSVLPRLGPSPGFALIDQNGTPVSSESLRGDIVVFGVASLACDAACLASIETLREVGASFTSRGEDADPNLRLVMVVVDAVEDPARLARFAEEHGIDGESWSVLSGSEAAVRALVTSGFELRLAAEGAGVEYESAVFLADHVGFVRGEYRSSDPSAAVISGDIERVLDEARASGVGGLLYNAAHSFSLSCGG